MAHTRSNTKLKTYKHTRLKNTLFKGLKVLEFRSAHRKPEEDKLKNCQKTHFILLTIYSLLLFLQNKFNSFNFYKRTVSVHIPNVQFLLKEVFNSF